MENWSIYQRRLPQKIPVRSVQMGKSYHNNRFMEVDNTCSESRTPWNPCA